MINSDKDLEREVIGNAIANEGACIDMLEVIRQPDVFTDIDCQKCFKAIRELYNEGQAITLTSVPVKLSELKLGHRDEYSMVVVELFGLVSITAKQKQNCEYLIRFYVQRRIGIAGLHIKHLEENDTLDHRSLITTATQYIDQIDKDVSFVEETNWEDDVAEAFDEIESLTKGVQVNGVAAGLYDVDRVTGGYGNGKLITIAGRPGMGKTALAMHSAINCAKRKEGVLFISREMGKSELIKRMIAATSETLAMVDVFHKGAKAERLKFDKDRILNSPIFIDEKSRNLNQIIYKIKKYKAQKGIKLVIIDYLQLLKGFEGKRYQGDTAELTEITRELKQVAKSADVPLILLSQLNREVERRTPPEPKMSDLKQTGSIEEDSDIVQLIYRPGYYDNDDQSGIVKITIAKNRQGRTGFVEAIYKGEKTAFYDLPQPGEAPYNPQPSTFLDDSEEPEQDFPFG